MKWTCTFVLRYIHQIPSCVHDVLKCVVESLFFVILWCHVSENCKKCVN